MKQYEAPRQLAIPRRVKGDHDFLCPACNARIQVQPLGSTPGEAAIALPEPDISVYASLGLVADVSSPHYQRLQSLRQDYSRLMTWAVIFGQNIRAVRMYEMQLPLKNAGKRLGVSASTLRSYELAEWGRIRISYGRIISCICRGYSYSHDHLSNADFLVRPEDGYWRGMTKDLPWVDRGYLTGRSMFRHPLMVSIPESIRLVASKQGLLPEEVELLFSRPRIDPAEITEAQTQPQHQT